MKTNFICLSALTREYLERELNRLGDLGYVYAGETITRTEDGPLGIIVMSKAVAA